MAPDSVAYEKAKALQSRLESNTSFKYDAGDGAQSKPAPTIPGTFKSPVSSNVLEEVA